MMPKSNMGAWAALSGLLLLAACGAEAPPPAEPMAPVFEADANWPGPLPEGWVFGPITGVSIDSRDHVWLLHAPGGRGPEDEAAIFAPGLVEFDAEGNFVQAWGEGEGYAWPGVPHGIFVDHQDNVWVSARSTHQILKFSRDGNLLLTIGELNASGGSADPERLGSPADVWVDPSNNEVYVADGYGNRRIVVFDGDTGGYLRHWGAYGEAPDDDYEYGSREADAPPARQFGTVHGLALSDDGLLYVADRRNNRIQVFRKDGSFVDERIVAPGTMASGSAFDLAFSADPAQEFLYLADGTNHTVWVLRRANLEVLDSFGSPGDGLGQLARPHNMDADSRGHVYVGEADNSRPQRFLFRGTVPVSALDVP